MSTYYAVHGMNSIAYNITYNMILIHWRLQANNHVRWIKFRTVCYTQRGFAALAVKCISIYANQTISIYITWLVAFKFSFSLISIYSWAISNIKDIILQTYSMYRFSFRLFKIDIWHVILLLDITFIVFRN